MVKLIILAGAPSPSALSTSKPLLDAFTAPLTSLLPPAHRDSFCSTPSSEPTQPPLPAWRSVPLHKTRLRTGDTQHTAPAASLSPEYPSFLHPHFLVTSHSASSSAPFCPTGEVSSSIVYEGVTDCGSAESQSQSQNLETQFYEHSIMLYDSFAVSSQASSASFPPSSVCDGGAEDYEEDDEDDEEDYSAVASLEPAVYAPPPIDLCTLRPPRTIRGFDEPPVVSLIVGVLSLEEKVVQTRWGERHLLEVLVGDDTRSAFQLTFWLSGPRPTSQDGGTQRRVPGGRLAGLDRDVVDLRIGDIILVQNVRVAVFRGRVYGQSSKGGVATRMHLLFGETAVDPRETGGPGAARGHYSWNDILVEDGVHPQLGKTRRVRRWLSRFVGAIGGGAGDEDGGHVQDSMPDDTIVYDPL